MNRKKKMNQGSSETKRNGSKGRSLWLFVVLAFVLLIGAWFSLIRIAQKNKPEFVSLETEPLSHVEH